MKRIASVLFTLTIAANASALSGARQRPQQRPTNPSHPVVNINTATEAQLMLLPGVGAKVATAIYTYAEAGKDNKGAAECDHKCHFKSVNQLLDVKGIGTARLSKMRKYVVLSGPTTAVVKISEPKGEK
jgi:competence ComEA-like helix-hairpin-helix protein